MKKHLVLFITIVIFTSSSAQPVVTSFSPTSGPIGTSVTITGTNFSPTPSSNIVYFGAVRSTVTAATPNSLTVSVPLGTTYEPITVTTGGLTAYSAKPFIVTFSGGGNAFTAGSFGVKKNFNTPANPLRNACADFDGDGLTDIVVANNTFNQISVYGNYSTTQQFLFDPSANFSTGAYPFFIATGDINGDGKTDIAVSNMNANTVSVFKNTSFPGFISFAPQVVVATGVSPYGITIGDLNEDGKPDIATANSSGSNVSVLKNTTSGAAISFAPKVDFSVGIYPQGLTIGDINSDGKMDIAVVCVAFDQVDILKNTSVAGSISFAPAQTFSAGFGSNTRFVSLGDLDNDNKPDMVLTNTGSANLSVLRNTTAAGVINFAAVQYFATEQQPGLTVLADYNGDGKPDIAAANENSNNVSILKNTSVTGTISFAARKNYAVEAGPTNIIGADLNNDGRIDISSVNYNADGFSVLKNRVTETSIARINPTSGVVGTQVYITGANFSGATSVKFGGTPATSFTVLSSDSVRAFVGGGSSGAVSVTTPLGSDTLTGFTLVGYPIISSFTPQRAGSGDTVYINGNFFGGTTSVHFGNTNAATFQFISDHLIKAVVDTGSTGKVKITTPGGSDSLGGFVYEQSAFIESSTLDIYSDFEDAAIGKIMPYTIPYSFQSLLDTNNIIIRLIKDHKSTFVSSIPPVTTINADTLQWNMTYYVPYVNDSIRLNLLINETPNVQLGDTIKQKASIQFLTADPFIVKRTDSIQQVITAICTAPNLVRTTLDPPQGIQWLRTLGGSKDDDSYGAAVCNDTSFVVVGNTYSYDGDFTAGATDSNNAFIAKYNTNGNLLWKKIIGGNGYDELYAIQKNSDGSFIATGYSESDNGTFSSNHGYGDAWVIKLDSAGNTIWQKLLGGSFEESGYAIQPTTDGGYILTGNTRSDDGDVISPYTDTSYHPWMVKLNATGTILWQKVFADSVLGDAFDIIQTLDGGYAIAGVTYDTVANYFQTPNGKLVKTNSMGNIIFAKSLILPEHQSNYYAVLQQPDSSYTIAGYVSKSYFSDTTCIGDHGSWDLLVSKIDKAGNTLSKKFYGGTKDEEAYKIIKSTDGGFLVAGSTNSDDGNITNYHQGGAPYFPDDGWLLKLDANANLVWQKTIGGDQFDEIASVLQFPDNNIVIAGNTLSDNNGDIFNFKGNLDVFVAKIGSANFIRGYVFADMNGDGIKQPSETYFNNGFVNSTKGSLVSASNINNGFYANSTDTGRYITKPVIQNSYFISNPLADTATFITYLQSDTANFAMVPIPGINDLRVSLIPANIARPGFATQYLLRYENAGTTTIANGLLNLIKAPTSDFDSASLIPSGVSGDTISWNIASLAPLQNNTITVYLHLLPPPQNNIGDTLILKASVSPLIGDSTPADNQTTIFQPVSGSFDPNAKTETHGNHLTDEEIADGEYLNYVIYFQNTGNDTAFRVIVRDTLGTKLNWQSFEMIGTSHPYHLSIKDSNKLEWKFDPIILPDSNQNEPASHGFIAFKIKPKAGTNAGETITNKASIYFDFNLPVETNNQITPVSPGTYLCPGASTYYKSGYAGNNTYQWQVNTGSGFINLNNTTVYNGVTTDSLALTVPPTNYYGNKYRCVINGNTFSAIYTLRFGNRWTGNLNNAWENPANWNCGVLPDDFTDVFINSGLTMYPEVNTNTSCRNIKLQPGSSVLIKAGTTLTIKGR